MCAGNFLEARRLRDRRRRHGAGEHALDVREWNHRRLLPPRSLTRASHAAVRLTHRNHTAPSSTHAPPSNM